MMKHPKHTIANIILFLVSITVFSVIYIGVFKVSVSALCILFIFLILYGFCMEFSRKSMVELSKYGQKRIHFGLDEKDDSKILLFSLTTLSPTYFCIILVSLVPLYTYEIWFISVFPCIFLNCLPASSVLEEYRILTHKRLPFLTLFLLLTVICCLLGVSLAHLFLK